MCTILNLIHHSLAFLHFTQNLLELKITNYRIIIYAQGKINSPNPNPCSSSFLFPCNRQSFIHFFPFFNLLPAKSLFNHPMINMFTEEFW